MIPKVIHYCWFGGAPLPELAQKCIGSWKKYCPDYEIIEWNESNYDVTKNQYLREAFQAKQWGFIADYARLDVIIENGGIYLDTDVEIIKPIDNLLTEKAFVGFEDSSHINFGQGFGGEKGSFFLKYVMDTSYGKRHMIRDDGSLDLLPSPQVNTSAFVKKGLVLDNSKQELNGITVFPSDYFCPKDYLTRRLHITPNTYSIHHFDGSWLPESERYRIALRAKLYRFMPRKMAGGVARIAARLKYRK